MTVLSEPTRKATPAVELSGRALARNTVWNLIGQIAPLLVAVFAIPLLISRMGLDRFGVLTLGWIVIGYFGLFDLGLGRALTKLVADRLGTGEQTRIPAVFWTAMALIVGLSFVGGAVLFGLSFRLAGLLHIPSRLTSETVHAFWVLAVGVPIVIASTGLRGVLEALQRFDIINVIRTPMGIFNFIAPLAVLPFSRSLVLVFAALVVCRFVLLVAFGVACLRVFPPLARLHFDSKLIWPVLRLGSWMTVSNIIGPLMVYLDRFLIGATLSVAAVAYYATPFDVVTKLLMVPAALVGVLFPALATSFTADPKRAATLLRRSVKYIFLLIFPVVLIIVLFARDGLSLWLGPDFARHSASVLRWLAAGVFINCLAQVPFTALQSVGRPHVTATLHMIELPLYVLALFGLIRWMGIEGAAIAWTARVTIDAIFLFVAARPCLPNGDPLLRRLTLASMSALGLLTLAALSNGLLLRAAVLVIVLPGLAVVTWGYLLSPEERALVRLPLQTSRL
jgi:O-antigen/teichoic acid export membrane protein